MLPLTFGSLGSTLRIVSSSSAAAGDEEESKAAYASGGEQDGSPSSGLQKYGSTACRFAYTWVQVYGDEAHQAILLSPIVLAIPFC